jgi:molybdopterin/thiamine biosynthesis adenylyltransferase
VGRFHLAEFDRFDLANFNRQAGAAMSSIDQLKLDVMIALARDINPELEIRSFADGVTPENCAPFLENVDVFVDGLDFFAFDTREAVFAACYTRAIPAVTVAPLGMGAALLNFLPVGMSFADYFGFAHCADAEKPLRFLLGLSPAMLHRKYLADISFVDLESGRGPSTPMACQLCAGIAATETLKLLLGRGKVVAAPRGVHFDAYRNKLAHTWRPGGWRNPLQRIVEAVARRELARPSSSRS